MSPKTDTAALTEQLREFDEQLLALDREIKDAKREGVEAVRLLASAEQDLADYRRAVVARRREPDEDLERELERRMEANRREVLYDENLPATIRVERALHAPTEARVAGLSDRRDDLAAERLQFAEDNDVKGALIAEARALRDEISDELASKLAAYAERWDATAERWTVLLGTARTPPNLPKRLSDQLTTAIEDIGRQKPYELLPAPRGALAGQPEDGREHLRASKMVSRSALEIARARRQDELAKSKPKPARSVGERAAQKPYRSSRDRRARRR